LLKATIAVQLVANQALSAHIVLALGFNQTIG